MSFKTLLLAVYLKWLITVRRFLKFLPIAAKTRKRLDNNFKLKQIAERSKLQRAAVRELFGQHSQGVLFKTENGYLVNSFDDVQVNRYLGNTGSYNPSEVYTLLGLLNSSSCLYVIGTHIGALLVPLAKKVSTVIGFEANPETYRFLQLNMALNNLLNAAAYNCAIFDKKDSLSFYQNKANSGGSKIKPVIEDYRYNYDKPDVITVSGDTLDALKEQHNLPYPTMIVMDIEGAEYFALKGGQTCLQHTQVLYMEFVPHHLSNVANVSLQDFCRLFTPHFTAMTLIAEEIKKSGIVYRGDEIITRLAQLYNAGISADLLLFKQL
ncbi:MAG TPA: FkbM family methyltransferase [Chitinophagaceae bacterium]|nr:FkbM family methyltransferase [Chitinophagaceae bacterium]